VSLVLSRCLLVALAVLAGVWLVLGFRSAALESDGIAAAVRAGRGELSPGGLERARDSLRRARQFGADGGPLFNEGLLLLRAGRRADAAAVAERLVALERNNFDGWYLLYAASLGRDRKRAREAIFVASGLNPHVDRTLR
jgi:hypothetical protein